MPMLVAIELWWFAKIPDETFAGFRLPFTIR